MVLGAFHILGRIDLDDVPKDRMSADPDHGLEMRLLGDAGAEATGKNDGFHGVARAPRPLGQLSAHFIPAYLECARDARHSIMLRAR